MTFGRSGRATAADEPSVEPVAWENVRKFVVGSVERPKSAKRSRSVWGKPAIRTPMGTKSLPVMAPCAYLGSSSVPNLPSRPEFTLYEDAGALRLLCYVEEPQNINRVQCYTVRDWQGDPIGALHRVPPKGPFKHTWRIQQPGRPEIAGRNEWASGGATQIAGRAAGRFVTRLVDDLLDPAEGDTSGKGPRTLEWRADDAVVMTSRGSSEVLVKADWVDRRLVFAFALVGDK